MGIGFKKKRKRRKESGALKSYAAIVNTRKKNVQVKVRGAYCMHADGVLGREKGMGSLNSDLLCYAVLWLCYV